MAYSSKYTLPSFLDARILGRAQAALNHLKASPSVSSSSSCVGNVWYWTVLVCRLMAQGCAMSDQGECVTRSMLDKKHCATA
eukprot:1146130-Pelagomonas_calceolata.AAC.3